MKSKLIEITVPVRLVAPPRWSASFQEDRLVYEESFDGVEEVDSEVMDRTKFLAEMLTSGMGLDVKTDFDGKTFRVEFPDSLVALRFLASEIITQLEIHDQLGYGAFDEIKRQLSKPPPASFPPRVPGPVVPQELFEVK